MHDHHVFTNNFLCEKHGNLHAESGSYGGWRYAYPPYDPVGRISEASSGIVWQSVAACALTVAVTQRFQQAGQQAGRTEAVVTGVRPVGAKQLVGNRRGTAARLQRYARRPQV